MILVQKDTVPEFYRYYSQDEPLPKVFFVSKKFEWESLFHGAGSSNANMFSFAPFLTSSMRFLSTHRVVSPALNKVRDSFPPSPAAAVTNEAYGIGLQKVQVSHNHQFNPLQPSTFVSPLTLTRCVPFAEPIICELFLMYAGSVWLWKCGVK